MDLSDIKHAIVTYRKFSHTNTNSINQIGEVATLICFK